MIWKDVEKTYGKPLADKMKESSYLDGITIIMRDGEADIPESDIHRAFKDTVGLKICPGEWD